MPTPIFQNVVAGVRVSARAALAMALSLCVLTGAQAWGIDGHRAVANLAEAQLSARTKAEVARLLALEPGATLASISTYADEHRDSSTARWHYVNFPRESCMYQAERDCPDGQCVVAALDAQSRVLSSKASDKDKLLALKWVVHLAGDIHQPLHAGYGDDRGGNSYQLQAFGRGTNLHALWDVGLIRGAADDEATLTKRLIGRPVAVGEASAKSVKMAEESCQIVAEPGFYPSRTLEQQYVIRYMPIVDERLRLAGGRLARLLNEALSR